MNIFDYGITFSELRDHINLTFFVSGCPYKCKGCSWEGNKNDFKFISEDEFKKILSSYKRKCSAVVFLGGEWYEDFKSYINIASEMGYKVCLYTGMSTLDSFRTKYPVLLNNLDYIKVGGWVQSLGGLDSPKTNQRLYKLRNSEIEKEIKYYG